MYDYTIDPRIAPSGRPAHWLISFAASTVAMLALILFLAPLLRNRDHPVANRPQPAEFDLRSESLLPLPPRPVPTAVPVLTPPPTPTLTQPPMLRPPDPLQHPPIPPPEPAQPLPPPPQPQPPVAAPPDKQPDPPGATEKPLEGDTPLAFNTNPVDDPERPPNARIAGETNTAAHSENPTPGSHDPVPLSPHGKASEVLAMGESGTPGNPSKGSTTAMAPNPGTGTTVPTPATPTTAPTPAVATPEPPRKPAVEPTDAELAHAAQVAAQAAAASAAPRGDPVGTATHGIFQPTPPAQPLPPAAPPAAPQPVAIPLPPPPAVQPDPDIGTQTTLVPAPAPAQPAQSGSTAQPAPPTPPAKPALPPPADPALVQHGEHGLVDSATGTNPTATAPAGTGTAPQGQDAASAAAALAEQQKMLTALKTADAAKPGPAAQPATVQVTEAPTAGDPNAASKTPLWTLRLNTEKAGPNTIETYKEPAAKYLREFRTVLEQSFYREASLPRAYQFREGEFADFEMTFHADGTIDGVRLVPDSGSKYFTPEMEAICKAAIARSAPYKAFTEELLKERKQFTLKVRFQF